jgi:hypothetical protein
VIQPAFRFRGLKHDPHNQGYTLATAYILNGDSGQLSLISPQPEWLTDIEWAWRFIIYFLLKVADWFEYNIFCI